MASRAPFSRQAHRREGTADEWEFARAVEFVAATYGWGPDYIERTLTDEQLLVYLDAAQDRLSAEAKTRFEEAVESVRVGYIIANDRKAHQRWQSHSRRTSTGKGAGLTGMALERRIANLAATNPEYVVVGA